MTDKTGLTEVSTETSTVSADSAVPTAPATTDASSPTAPETGSVAEVPLTTDQLEREGDIAADYIEEFLDICDLDGDIDIDARNGRAYLSVKASDADNLRVLSKPETVNALQELTRLAVQNKTGSFSRLILDIGGSREAREAELATLVARAIERIVAGSREADLPAMSSYERKLVHDIVAASGGYRSESSGEGRDRHTVITAA
ncbi:R3H domain-containing nucleic acid-binding protein [Cryobacterium sp. N21]|uniref:Jag family protein n=1 Tax=Cryobacterium sp. N21 TaxID=2048289 RepID=UPI000CE2D60C|nr:R3H domain-containing nucleic acid-binding protein [Cryobacterium sp. N21]